LKYLYIYICQFNLYHVSSCPHHCISPHDTSTVTSFSIVIRQIFKWLVNKLKKRGKEDVHHARQVKRLCMMTILEHSSSFHSVTINLSLVASYFTHSNSIRSFMSKWRKKHRLEILFMVLQTPFPFLLIYRFPFLSFILKRGRWNK
jgi:hypothetical protein